MIILLDSLFAHTARASAAPMKGGIPRYDVALGCDALEEKVMESTRKSRMRARWHSST